MIYLFLLFISYDLRRLLDIIIYSIFDMNNSLIFCFLMCLGQIVGGSLIYLYQNASFKSKKKSNNANISYQLISIERGLKREDSKLKIGLLIFFASYFDLIEYILLANIIPKIGAISTTSSLRLCCIMTIISTITCRYTLRFKIGRHQIFSIIVLSICSSIIIILEFIYKPKEVDLDDFIISFLLVFCHLIFLSFTDIVERYLADYDYLNPLKILMSEGIFSFIMATCYSFIQNPFQEVKNIYEEVSTGKFILLIFLLFLYSVLSAGINVYKILCNVLYSPMTKSLSSYFLNSFFIIYHYIYGDDFISEGKKNFLYFFINVIFSVIIDIFGLIYNEFFILNCWALSKDTHEGISIRATMNIIEEYDINSIDTEE